VHCQSGIAERKQLEFRNIHRTGMTSAANSLNEWLARGRRQVHVC
jgi:hypothetical protein